jgi:hypothetical protein
MYTAYVERLKDHLGEDAIFVDDSLASDADLRACFEEVAWEPPFPIYRRPVYEEPIRVMHIARLRRYRRYLGTHRADGG